MKTTRNLMLTIATGLILVACTSTDSLIDKYEKACKEGDIKTASELAQKLEKKDLTTEQNMRIVNASFELGTKAAGDIFKGVMNVATETLENSMKVAERFDEEENHLNNYERANNKWDRVLDEYDECVTKYAKLVAKDKAGDDVEDAMDRIDDKIDELFEKLDQAEKSETELTPSQSKRFSDIFDRWYEIDD